MTGNEWNDGEGGASSVDRTVAMFHRIDRKVDAMRTARLRDPDTLGDKIIKSALPALIGLVAGKCFEVLWAKGTHTPARPGYLRRHTTVGKVLGGSAESTDDAGRQGLLMAVLFAAASAAFGTLVSQLADRGSRAFVARLQRHRK